MQQAPAHHLGPMRMGLREPVGIDPLCRVASHALFGPRSRSGSPPGAERSDSTKTARRHKRNLPKHRTISHRLANRPHCDPDEVQRFQTTDYTTGGEAEDGRPPPFPMLPSNIHGWCFAPPLLLSVSIRVIRGQNYQRGTFISRITATSQQDQITRPRGWRPRRPGTNHPLSLSRGQRNGDKGMPERSTQTPFPRPPSSVFLSLA
jgi:hypothetical protein